MQLLTVVVLAANAVFSADSGELRREELMMALQGGGYTIILRHARTDRSYQEEIGSVPLERSKQRNLSADGVRDAALIGVVLRKHRVPIGEIASSPMFRTRETAEYAAGPPTRVTMALRVFPTTDETAAIVAAAPERGTNRLLVTHHFVIERYVPGIQPGDIGESEAAVVKLDGEGNVVLVGRITLADWEQLAGAERRVSQTLTTRQPPAQATASAPNGPVTVPGTVAGQLAQRYVEAFNAGVEPMRHFIESSLVPSPDRRLETRLETYRSSFEMLGPLTVTGVRPSAADEVSLTVQTKRGELFVTVKASAEHSGRAASITIGAPQGRHP
jgi:phosphohistidine phosphatase SixA